MEFATAADYTLLGCSLLTASEVTDTVMSSSLRRTLLVQVTALDGPVGPHALHKPRCRGCGFRTLRCWCATSSNALVACCTLLAAMAAAQHASRAQHAQYHQDAGAQCEHLSSAPATGANTVA